MNELTGFEQSMIYMTLVIAVIGLIYALYLRAEVLAKDKGTPAMQKVWNAIKTGALAYLQRQAKAIMPLIAVLTVALFLSVYIVPPTHEAVDHFKAQGITDTNTITLIIAIGRALAFIMGAMFSLAVGQMGMRIAVDANVRVASEARRSFGGAMKLAYRAGTVTGMLTDALGLFGGTIIFIIFGRATPDVLLGYGFGATLLALFMRVGGGIFTKAADVGADLVGKVEQGLEEDDRRNAAVIADLVGDNVGDCAGMAADIFESYEVTIVSGLILGLALTALTGSLQWIVFPLVIRGIGVASSIVGTFLVKADSGKDGRDALKAINKGFYISAVISVILFAIFSVFYMKNGNNVELRPFFSVALGVALVLIIDKLTEYFTDTHYKPIKDISKATGGGPATAILSGMVVGKESAVWTTLVIAAAIGVSLFIWSDAGVAYVLYGIAMTGIGMLSLTGNNVAMDSFGPISDNANGVAEMGGETGECRRVLDELDAVGNTTKAITKGVAIGSAVIAAVSLFGSFITDVNTVLSTLKQPLMTGINVANPKVFIGLLIGGTIPWLFSSIAIKAVERAAGLIVDEVRRQFRNPDIMSYKIEPDYKAAVSISTQAAQRELMTLALLSVLGPIIVGPLLGVEALGGFLAGVILSGQLLAVYMANAGGAWDNAKKLIETEPRNKEKNTGKGSDRHKAAVVGDTVGDPLKDTSGPALNPMIKVINLVSVIIAPLVVTYANNPISIILSLAMVGVFGWVVLNSKKDPA